MKITTPLTELLDLDFPLVMAPMFLVSNEAMMVEGMKAGIAASFPSLNFRKEGELAEVLDRLNAVDANASGTYGVNLIVQQTNPLYKKHLQVCVERKVPYYITSLGKPLEVIEAVKGYGAKVFCDVTNMKHAQKAAECGCDGFVAVGPKAGGHAGPQPLEVFVPELKQAFPDMIVMAAGGIANGQGIADVLAMGADAAYMGTRFIACTEATVNDAYKQAVVDAKAKDIVMTDKLSGTPCAVINTPYVQKMGLKQNAFQRWLNKNKRTKKWFKTLLQIRGFKKFERSVQPANYQTVWSAGQSVEDIHDILPCTEIIHRLRQETEQAIGE